MDVSKKIKKFFFGCWCLAACPMLLLATTAGPNVGATATSVNFGILQDPWGGSITSAQQNDGAFATAAVDKNDNGTEYLQLVNFGFAIPDGSTIVGIQVDWKMKGVPCLPSCTGEGPTKIVKGGVVSGNDLSGTATPSMGGIWPASSTLESFGGPTELWGLSWTPAEINASNFGAVIASGGTTDNGNTTAFVDYVQITVTYTGGGGGPTYKKGQFLEMLQ